MISFALVFTPSLIALGVGMTSNSFSVLLPFVVIEIAWA